MTYMKVEWKHNIEREPIELLSELDPHRRETRKVEVFRDGTLSFAGSDGASGETLLGEAFYLPCPPLLLTHSFKLPSSAKTNSSGPGAQQPWQRRLRSTS